jgi:predicted dehydrogenase
MAMLTPGLPGVVAEQRSFDQCDTLMEEISAFVSAVRNGTAPVVSGEDGKRALDVATRITGKL